METLDRLERASEKYLRFAENDYVNAAVAALLIFTVSEEVLASFGQGLQGFKMKAEHGLLFLYLNLLLLSIARICRAYLHQKRNFRGQQT
jgi:hypothetical protein